MYAFLHVTYYFILLFSFVLYYATSFTFLTFSINSCNIVNLLGFLAFLTFLLIFICKYISEEGRRPKRRIKAGTVRSLLQVFFFYHFTHILKFTLKHCILLGSFYCEFIIWFTIKSRNQTITVSTCFSTILPYLWGIEHSKTPFSSPNSSTHTHTYIYIRIQLLNRINKNPSMGALAKMFWARASEHC